MLPRNSGRRLFDVDGLLAETLRVIRGSGNAPAALALPKREPARSSRINGLIELPPADSRSDQLGIPDPSPPRRDPVPLAAANFEVDSDQRSLPPLSIAQTGADPVVDEAPNDLVATSPDSPLPSAPSLDEFLAIARAEMQSLIDQFRAEVSRHDSTRLVSMQM